MISLAAALKYYFKLSSADHNSLMGNRSSLMGNRDSLMGNRDSPVKVLLQRKLFLAVSVGKPNVGTGNCKCFGGRFEYPG